LIMATSGDNFDWDGLNSDDTVEQPKNQINHQINSLQVTFESCENVFKAVYDVLRFLPNLDNPNSGYWEKEVIPNLSACLIQHVEARIFFHEAFGTINDLRNTMSSAAQVIKQSKVNFNEEHSNNRNELTKQYDTRYNMYAELEDLQAEINRYQCLIDATQPHFDSKIREISNINEEREQLTMLNEEVNKKLQNLPEEPSGVSIFGLHMRFKPDKWTDSENSKETKEKSQLYLTEYMEECKKKRDIAKITLKRKKEDIDEKMPGIEKRISSLLEIEKKLIENEKETYNKVGLRGGVLVEALRSIRIFSETVGKEASAYAPLTAFLISIKRMIQIDVDLLLKSDKPSIFIAVNRILDNIKELSEYYDSVGSLMQQLSQTKDLNSIPNAIEYEEP
ncbi:unnamed protein product, partial [Oppiella nova]